MADLFDDAADQALRAHAPLAARMRPRTLEEFVGQREVVGPGTVLRLAIESDQLSSLILYGPAGSGKTSLARIIANTTDAYFAEISAVSSGVADIRAAIEGARQCLATKGQRTILFVDEVHRFSKSQQDALLHAVEDSLLILVGATTENPFFEVNAPLLSRSRIVELQPLGDDDVHEILQRAISDTRGLDGAYELETDAEEHIVRMAGGDARVALTTLEIAAKCKRDAGKGVAAKIALGDVRSAALTRPTAYDKDGDAHYDIVSAFIKSMRGSDPDAAVYWLARMVQGGEDPKFIARRIMIFASEDIGNADPRALLVAAAAFKAAEAIGWPECRIGLSQAAVYMALAPKSNASYRAIEDALTEVRQGPARAVPDHLRDRHRPGAEEYPAYVYPHDYPRGSVTQQYLPDGLQGRRFFVPGERGWEARQSDDSEEPI